MADSITSRPNFADQWPTPFAKIAKSLLNFVEGTKFEGMVSWGKAAQTGTILLCECKWVTVIWKAQLPVKGVECAIKA